MPDPTLIPRIEYDLARRVPEIARGCTLHTNYGDIAIPPGWMADRLQVEVERLLKEHLKTQKKVQSKRAAMAAAVINEVFGGVRK